MKNVLKKTALYLCAYFVVSHITFYREDMEWILSSLVFIVSSVAIWFSTMWFMKKYAIPKIMQRQNRVSSLKNV